jgi:hypothetical protein
VWASAGTDRAGKGHKTFLQRRGEKGAAGGRLTSVAIVEDVGYWVDRKEEAVVTEKKVRS